MQSRTATLIMRHSLWVSLLLHLFMLINFSFLWVIPQPKDNSSSYYVPAYTYHSPVPTPKPAPTPSKSAQQSQPSQAKQQQGHPQKALPKNKNGIEKIGLKKADEVPTPDQLQEMGSVPVSANNEDPVHLVGEKRVPKPLIMLLGKALTAHLKYPKTAVDFNIRGTAFISFVIHPDGSVTDVKLVQTSGTGVLDNEALESVAAISPVKNVNQYLQEAEYLVVGVIFG